MVFFVKLRALVSSWQKETKLNSYYFLHDKSGRLEIIQLKQQRRQHDES